MFLRCKKRKKDGKIHRNWSIVENRRVAGGRVVQKHVLYLGEINDSQREAWRRSIEVFEEGSPQAKTLALFPEDRAVDIDNDQIVHIRLDRMVLKRPRQWGGCWLACHLYRQLGLDHFWAEHLLPSRKGTQWDLILQLLVVYRLIQPGSEWRLHRHWFDQSAMADLLGGDFSLAESHRLYECHDKLLEHKSALFTHLTQRWKDLFNASFEVLLYDLTSSYFESDPPIGEGDKRKFGYSRDKRSDCVQVVVALIVTPEGFPIAYEVLSGNTADNTTLDGFLTRIEEQYGKADRIWVMDRGIPTEEILEKMRGMDPPVSYLVGTPKGRLARYEQRLIEEPWHVVHEGVSVKLCEEDKECYILAKSDRRILKERAMRRRKLKRLWKRLGEIAGMKCKRDERLMKLGAARKEAGRAWNLVEVNIDKKSGAIEYRLLKETLRQVRRREGRYLLRTNLENEDPARLWTLYVQLTEVEEAFKNLKGDLSIRPFHHQKMERIEAHIFISFLSYSLHVTLGARLKTLAPGLTTRSVLEKISSIQMLDVELPTTDGRTVHFSRYTHPEKDVQLLLKQLKLELPAQPPPTITSATPTV